MSDHNAALAEAIATGFEHIAKGLRQWAQAHRVVPAKAPEWTPPRPATDHRQVFSTSPEERGDQRDLPSSVRLLKVEEASRALGMARTGVYTLLASGEIRSIRIGRSRRIPLQEIERYIREGSGRRTIGG